MENTQSQAAAEPIVLAGGDSPASFEDLESVTQVKEDKPQKEEKTSKEKPAKESKETEAKTKEKENGEEESHQKESKEVTKKTEEIDKTDSSVKTLSIRVGDQDIAVRSDGLVPVKVAGKTKMVPLQDVINGYSGQSHLQEQYGTYKKERAEWESKRKTLDEFISGAHKKLTDQGDLRGFIEDISKAFGQDPNDVWSKTVGKLEQDTESLLQMTPEQRQAKKAQDELEYYKRRDSELKAKAQREAEVRDLEVKAQQMMEKHGIDQETLAKRYDELVKLGSVKPEEITLESVVNFHKNMAKFESIERMVDELAPELEGREKEIEKLGMYAIQIDASEAEIAEAIKQLYSNQSERKLAKKIEKLEKKARGETKVVDPQKSPTFFDELG